MGSPCGIFLSADAQCLDPKQANVEGFSLQLRRGGDALYLGRLSNMCSCGY